MTTRSCIQCGNPLPSPAKFCGQCGTVNPSPPEAPGGAAPYAALGPAPKPELRADPTRTLIHPAGPAPNPPQASKVAPASGGLKQTMLGFGGAAVAQPPAPSLQPQPQPQPPAPVASPPVAPAPGGGGHSFKSTMLGGVFSAPAPSPAPPSAPIAQGPTAPPAVASFKSTMLGGVAPGMPVAPPAPAPPRAGSFKSTMLGGMAPGIPAAPPPGVGGPPAPGGSPGRGSIGSNTVLGVAIPGIAPTRPGEAPPQTAAARPGGTLLVPGAPARPAQDGRPAPVILPAPAPLEELPAPSRPRIVRKGGGVPLVAVALVTGGLVVVGGGAIALLWHGAPPISAQPRVTPDGKDVLHLHCDPTSCGNGTTAELNGLRATFAEGESDLPLAEPLRVGDNALELRVDRPGMGRDEVVRLVVPVAYRVRADVSTMGSQHPSVTIHVDALPGSDVRISGKPVALDGKGVGAYALDESEATEGPADESRVVSVDVPYTVAAPATSAARPPEGGTVSARVAISPLRVDAPSARAVVAADHILVAGRAAKGANVSIDGVPAGINPDGAFEVNVPLPALGEQTLQIRSGTAALVSRTVHLAVKRVASLIDEARAFEQQPTVGYDTAMSGLGPAASGAGAGLGQLIVVDGEVIEPRASGHRMLILVDDKRGCARGPCLARVVVGQDLAVARGDRLRAYGRVARAFTTPGGQTVPEVEADFVLQSRR